MKLHGATAPAFQKFLRFGGALGPTALALGLQFMAFAVTARGLGVVQFGEYAAIQGVAAICVEMVGLGGADLLVRAVARQPEDFSRYFGNMLNLVWVTLVPVIGIAFLSLAWDSSLAITWPLLLLALTGEIVLGRIASSIELTMVAHSQVFRASVTRMVPPLARLASAATFFHYAHDLSGWIMVVFTQAITVSVGLTGVAVAFYGRPAKCLFLGQWKTGATFSINQISRAAQSNLDRVILAQFADAASLGVYSAGSRVLQLGLFPLQIMTRILYPQFFVHGAKGIAATRRYALSNLPPMLATGLFSAAIVAGAGYFAPFLLGKAFEQSRHAAMLLSLSLPLIALQYLAADILTGAGFQHVRAVIYAAAAISFGLILAAGARAGGTDGMITGYLVAHALLAATLWATAFSLTDKSVQA
jgi:O-antigen/teichoic acid export membrane protein